MPESSSVLSWGLNEVAFSVDEVPPGKERFPAKKACDALLRQLLLHHGNICVTILLSQDRFDV